MRRMARTVAAAAIVLGAFGCAPLPFVPGPAQVARIDFSEAGQPLSTWKASLDRRVFPNTGAATLTVLLDDAALGKAAMLRLDIAGERGTIAKMTYKDLRNTRMDIRLDFNDAPAGEYELRLELTTPAGKVRTLTLPLTLEAAAME